MCVSIPSRASVARRPKIASQESDALARKTGPWLVNHVLWERLPSLSVRATGGDPGSQLLQPPEHRPSDPHRLGDLAGGVPSPPGPQRHLAQPSGVGSAEEEREPSLAVGTRPRRLRQRLWSVHNVRSPEGFRATALWRFIYAVWKRIVRIPWKSSAAAFPGRWNRSTGNPRGRNIRTVLKFFARNDFGQDRPWPMSALDRTGRYVRIGVCVH